MSSEPWDLSPIRVDRQQDITFWPEADITRLAEREAKLYKKRKSAIEDYFKTDQPAKEIRQRHHLSTKESIEALARRCLMLHADGQIWGFRALVPGVTVINHALKSQGAAAEEQAPIESFTQIEVAELEKLEDRLQNEPEKAGDVSLPLTSAIVLEQPAAQQAKIVEPVSSEAVERAEPEHQASQHIAEDAEQTELIEPASTEAVERAEPEHQASQHIAEDAEQTELIEPASAEAVERAEPECEEPRHLAEDAEQTELVEPAPTEAAERAEPEHQESQHIAEDAEQTELISAEAAERAEPECEETQHLAEDAEQDLVSDEKECVAEIPLTQPLEVPEHKNKQLTVLTMPVQTFAGENGHHATESLTPIRIFVRRRRERQEKLKKHQLWIRIVSVAVVLSILIGLSLPLFAGLMAYNTYMQIKGVAVDGVDNLLALKALIPDSKNDLTASLNAQKLTQADTRLVNAQDDFLQLQSMVNEPEVQSLLQEFAPQYSGKLGMARHLLQVALDVTHMGQELLNVAHIGTNIIHSPLVSASTSPLITVNDISAIEATLIHTQYYIHDIQQQMSQVNLAEVPLGNASQKAELAKYLQMIPQAQSLIDQVQPLIGPVSWLLGIGHARHFLVQTLDRGELRPSGGFEGQYGVFTLQNGRMGPFSLKDITLLDYAENGAELGTSPPAQYNWINFGNFGVRDANLSADYPTTAQMVMSYFEQEGGGPVDGDIQITPVVIEQFLKLTGPIYLSQYHDTVTAQNLEVKLHAYQQDPTLIALQKQITGSNTHATRKAFTSLVGTLLLARAKHLSINQMLDFGKTLLKDLKTRDLQVYFTNPIAEQWLAKNDDTGAMPRFTNGTDGFMVVQANISISKASQYVASTFNDQVVLDSSGGATDNLTITLNYQQTGPVYGYDTYADYLRVYAPANAQFLNGYGFISNKSLCTPSTKGSGSNNPSGDGKGSGGSSPGGGKKGSKPPTNCSQYNTSFPDTGYRYCPQGDYALGTDGMVNKPWPIDQLSGPTATNSDLPGYAMWGGLTLTPKNCITTLTLSWYVPQVVKGTPGRSPYRMIVGHQAGWPITAQVSIDASALKGVKSLSYSRTIDVDTLIALHARPLPPAKKKKKHIPAPTPGIVPKKEE